MRYVAVCTKGSHIQDVPWFMWAHRGTDRGVTDAVRHCRAYKELSFVRSAKQGEGLAALRVVLRCLQALPPAVGTRAQGRLVAGRHPLYGHAALGGLQSGSAVRAQAGSGATRRDRQLHRRTPVRAGHSRGATGIAGARWTRFGRTCTSRRWSPTTGGRKPRWSRGGLPTSSARRRRSSSTSPPAKSRYRRTRLSSSSRTGSGQPFLKKLDAGRDRSGGDFVVDGCPRPSRQGWPVALTDKLVSIGQVRRVREVRALRRFQRQNTDADFIGADLGPDRRHRTGLPRRRDVR